MRKQDWLSRYKWASQRVNDLTMHVQMLRQQAVNISPRINDIGGGAGTRKHDKIGEIIARIQEKENDLIREVEEMLDIQNEITKAINAVPDEKQREVLYKRYILFESYEEIAEELGITVRYTYTLHGYGLLSVKEQ